MRKNYPRRTQRDPEEYYDHIYRSIPQEPETIRIIDHPRKLVTHNLCANPYTATPRVISWERTCYDADPDD